MSTSRDIYLRIDEYRKLIESDRRFFFRNDPELAISSTVPHPLLRNTIACASGRMACMFPLRCGSGKVAVKLFFTPIPELAVRYEQIDAALTKIHSPNFLKIEYRDGPKKGASLGANYTPYLKMDFVQGDLLRDAIVKLVDKHDSAGLLNMAKQWQDIALMMERERICHGDIQAQNLMVETSGRLRLIDLDTMFVPTMQSRNLKCVGLGVPAWQHKDKVNPRPGVETPFDERMDRFPAIALYLTLLALSDHPTLFNPQAVADDDEILFTAKDITDPHNSRVLRQLSTSTNPQIRCLTDILVKAALGPYDDVPAFSKVADPDAEAKEALLAMEQAVRIGDHRRVCATWKPVLDSYAPAQSVKSEFILARKHLEKLECLCGASRAEDDKFLAQIWLAPPSLVQCACSKTEKVDGGMSVADRGALAVKRIEGMEAVRRAINAAEQVKRQTGLFGGVEESGIVDAWNDPVYDLGKCQTAIAGCLDRVNEAWSRLSALNDFQGILATEDDETIAKAWQTVSTFAPAIPHQKRATDAAERIKVLAEFIARLRLDQNDEGGLWQIWQSRPDMALCKSAAKPVTQLGGLIPAQRAALAGRRVEAFAELKKIFDRYDRPPIQEAGERELIAAWRQREAVLGPGPMGAAYRKRADEAQKRLKTLETLRKGIGENDDEQIAKAWSSGLLNDFAPAQPFSAEAQDAVCRIAVISALVKCLQNDREDEQGLIEIASARSDMHKCRTFTNPAPQLDGKSWQARIKDAQKILHIHKQIMALRAARPVHYDQLVLAWGEGTCRNHSVFRKIQSELDHELGLGTSLLSLQRGLASKDIALISSSWRDEFRDLFTPDALDKIREAMRKQVTGPHCIECLNLSLADDSLTVEWHWKPAGQSCYVGAQEAKYPEARAGTRPNGFRVGAIGGRLIIPFSGRSPHVKVWAMFRFMDEFVLGEDPIEKRLVIVEYKVFKPTWRRHRLVLTSLCGELKVPPLAVTISANSIWASTEEAQVLPEMLLNQPRTIELDLPATLAQGEDLYLSIRPVDHDHEGWLHLKPRSTDDTRIRL